MDVTMRIFVMGLVAVFNRGGGDVDILLPKMPGHLPILAYSCTNANTCAGDAQNVKADLKLPNENLDGKLLYFKHSHFGAAKLKNVKVIKIRFDQQLKPVTAAAPYSAGRHHRWPMTMWYHQAGEVPQTGQQAKDASWLVSLKDILPCATPKALPELTAGSALAAYMSNPGSLGKPIVASLSSLVEYTNGACTSVGDGSTQPYTVSLDFNPSAQFTGQNQAAADAFYYEVTVDNSVKIYLELDGGTPTIITPDTGAPPVDILIANLTPYDTCNAACRFKTAPHPTAYDALFDGAADCKMPTAGLGWESTRTRQSDLVGNDLPDILGVVSVKNPGLVMDRPSVRQGYSRPLCYAITN